MSINCKHPGCRNFFECQQAINTCPTVENACYTIFVMTNEKKEASLKCSPFHDWKLHVTTMKNLNFPFDPLQGYVMVVLSDSYPHPGHITACSLGE